MTHIGAVHIVDLCIDVATGYLCVHRIHDWHSATTPKSLNVRRKKDPLLDESDDEGTIVALHKLNALF